MNNNLIIKDSLLYIAIFLISFGVSKIDLDFQMAIISLLIGAGLFVARGYLKKIGVIERSNK